MLGVGSHRGCGIRLCHSVLNFSLWRIGSAGKQEPAQFTSLVPGSLWLAVHSSEGWCLSSTEFHLHFIPSPLRCSTVRGSGPVMGASRQMPSSTWLAYPTASSAMPLCPTPALRAHAPHSRAAGLFLRGASSPYPRLQVVYQPPCLTFPPPLTAFPSAPPDGCHLTPWASPQCPSPCLLLLPLRPALSLSPWMLPVQRSRLGEGGLPLLWRQWECGASWQGRWRRYGTGSACAFLMRA